MKTFKVGDRVVIVGTRFHPELIGEVTTVLSVDHADRDGLVYELDIPNGDVTARIWPNLWSLPGHIEPLPDDSAELRKLCGAKESESA